MLRSISNLIYLDEYYNTTSNNNMVYENTEYLDDSHEDGFHSDTNIHNKFDYSQIVSMNN